MRLTINVQRETQDDRSCVSTFSAANCAEYLSEQLKRTLNIKSWSIAERTGDNSLRA